MAGQDEGTDRSRRRAGRLRLVVGVPVTLTLVGLAAGVGAINLLVHLNPAADEAGPRLFATLVVVGFSLAAGGVGYWFVRVLQRPLEELSRELERRLEETRSAAAGREPRVRAGGGSGDDGAPPSPAEEVASVRRTIEEYLAVLDEYRLDGALLEELEQGVLGLDREGRIVHANGRARAMLGSDGPLRGRLLEELLGEGASNMELRGMVRRCLAGVEEEDDLDRRTVVAEELAVEPPGGAPVPVRARAHSSPSGFSLAGGEREGERPVVLLTLQPAGRAESHELLLERRDRLAALGTLVAEVAHEIRNPLGSLRSLAELIAGRLPEGDPKREGLEEVIARVDRVVGYLDEVLDYAQPRRLEREPMEVEELLAGAAEAAEQEARDGEVGVRVERAAGTPDRVRVDPERMLQVLENLARNGVQHADEGGEVLLRARAVDDGELMLEVHNTGSYIPEEERAAIFRPFESGRRDGTGLGLTLARYLVRLHGGRLGVESDRERGTTFRVVLPEA